MRDDIDALPAGEQVEAAGSAKHDDAAMQGRIVNDEPAGTTPTGDRPSYRDPVSGNIDPTAPGSPEKAP